MLIKIIRKGLLGTKCTNALRHVERPFIPSLDIPIHHLNCSHYYTLAMVDAVTLPRTPFRPLKWDKQPEPQQKLHDRREKVDSAQGKQDNDRIHSQEGIVDTPSPTHRLPNPKRTTSTHENTTNTEEQDEGHALQRWSGQAPTVGASSVTTRDDLGDRTSSSPSQSPSSKATSYPPSRQSSILRRHISLPMLTLGQNLFIDFTTDFSKLGSEWAECATRGRQPTRGNSESAASPQPQRVERVGDEWESELASLLQLDSLDDVRSAQPQDHNERRHARYIPQRPSSLVSNLSETSSLHPNVGREPEHDDTEPFPAPTPAEWLRNYIPHSGSQSILPPLSFVTPESGKNNFIDQVTLEVDRSLMDASPSPMHPRHPARPLRDRFPISPARTTPESIIDEERETGHIADNSPPPPPNPDPKKPSPRMKHLRTTMLVSTWIAALILCCCIMGIYHQPSAHPTETIRPLPSNNTFFHSHDYFYTVDWPSNFTPLSLNSLAQNATFGHQHLALGKRNVAKRDVQAAYMYSYAVNETTAASEVIHARRHTYNLPPGALSYNELTLNSSSNTTGLFIQMRCMVNYTMPSSTTSPSPQPANEITALYAPEPSHSNKILNNILTCLCFLPMWLVSYWVAGELGKKETEGKKVREKMWWGAVLVMVGLGSVFAGACLAWGVGEVVGVVAEREE
jgi:hypothetical protein